MINYTYTSYDGNSTIALINDGEWAWIDMRWRGRLVSGPPINRSEVTKLRDALTALLGDK